MSKSDLCVDNGEIRRYFTKLSECLIEAQVTSASGDPIDTAAVADENGGFSYLFLATVEFHNI